MVQSTVTEVSDANFAAEVLERSMMRPVIVDFWAPWCGPCRVLGPTIEKVAAEHADEVILVKLNTDENPVTASQFRIQSIPAVKAFVDGAVAAEFVGAIPEPQVRAFFQRVVPSPADRAVRQAEQIRSADQAEAERLLREVLTGAPTHAEALFGLASLLVDQGRTEEASFLLDRVSNDRRTKVLKHQIFLTEFAATHAHEDLQAEAIAHAGDPRARYRWGVMLAARGQYEAALDELLESLRLDRTFADGAARKAMLTVFDIVGVGSPLARQSQQRMASVLF